MKTLDYLTVEKIGYEDGVYFTLEVYKTEDDFYRCYAYAMASGCKITDWQYYALDIEEAYSEQTKEYLIRELKPIVKSQLIRLARIAESYLDNETKE
jgi:hypothetical protein